MTGRPDPHDTEGTVDRLEEKIFGHTIDQTRDEDAEQTPEDTPDGEPKPEPTD
ncbi:hypothetical protein GCM10009836_03530 [Pseudonocardia ailaonensis]|uniref:Autophagy-related protein 2 n=1 Tax=Pseudonocardia ailaonensis TaxID=367279 RepID=A0ABN2MKD8_9PSEU